MLHARDRARDALSALACQRARTPLDEKRSKLKHLISPAASMVSWRSCNYNAMLPLARAQRAGIPARTNNVALTSACLTGRAALALARATRSARWHGQRARTTPRSNTTAGSLMVVALRPAQAAVFARRRAERAQAPALAPSHLDDQRLTAIDLQPRQAL